MCQWSILQHSVYQFRIAWIDRSVWGKIPCWQRMACWGFEFWMSQVPKAILVYESPKSSQLECSQWSIGSQGKGKSGHLSLEEPICHSWQQWSMTRKLFSNNTSFISFFSFVKSCWTLLQLPPPEVAFSSAHQCPACLFALPATLTTENFLIPLSHIQEQQLANLFFKK